MNSMRRQSQRLRQRQRQQRNFLNGVTKKCYKYECNLQIKNNILNVSTIKTWMPSIIVIVRQQQRQQQRQLQQIKTKYFHTNSGERKQRASQQKQQQQEDKHHYRQHQHQQQQYNHHQRVQQHQHQQQQLVERKRGNNNATKIYANTYSTTADTSSLITQTTTPTAARGTTKKSGTKRLVIIMMLVFSIIQQQQQQQQVYQQSYSYNGVYAAAIAATQLPLPADVHYNSNNLNEQATIDRGKKQRGNGNGNSNFEQLQPQPQTQTEATNHTFKTFAFIDGYHTAQTTPADVEVPSESLPIFDFGMPRNITGRTGHTEAIIKCRVDRLNDKSVSWIRKRDLHILTVGTATYTSDKRFLVTESKNSREWTLHVKAPQARDSGIYECQVNTEPKMSMAFQLNIIEISPDAKAVIIGPPDLHFKVGSAIILNCVVQQPSIKDIGPMYWYRGEHMITPFDADDSVADAVTYTDANDNDNYAVRQDMYANKAMNDVITNELQKDFATRIAMETQLGDTLKSRLRIANAQTTDTGNYTCQPTTARSASVLVHVINDENPAAMQKSAAVASVKLNGMGNSMMATLKDVACLLLTLLLLF